MHDDAIAKLVGGILLAIVAIALALTVVSLVAALRRSSPPAHRSAPRG